MKIAYVVHTFDMGGLERIVAYLCNGLDRRRYEPMIVCLSRSGTASRWLTRTDVPIIELGKLPGRDWKITSRLAAVLRESRVDLVHSHNWGTLVETVVAARKAGRTPHIHAEHGTVMGGSRAGTVRKWINGRVMRWALSRCSRVVVVAPEVQARLQRLTKFPPDRTTLITNGVATPDCEDPARSRRDIRAQLGISESADVLGSVGRLSEVKSFHRAIESLARLRASGRDVHLVIVGEGKERDRLTETAARVQVTDRVHLPGAQSQVGPWLSSMDLYLNTSSSEGMSLGIIEAMSMGLPVVATDVGGNRALVDGDSACGAIVPPEDHLALDAAIAGILDSRDARHLFSQRATARYQAGYSSDVMFDKYDRLYMELAGGTPVPPTPTSVLAKSGGSA